MQIELFSKDERLQPLFCPLNIQKKGLEDIVNHVLSTSKQLEFVINQQLLTTSLYDFVTANGISTEQLLKIQFIEKLEFASNALPTNDWIASIVLTEEFAIHGSYDNQVYVQDYSQNILDCIQVGSVCKSLAIHSGHLLMGTLDKLHVYNLNKKRTIFSSAIHQKSVNAICSNDAVFCSGGWDNNICVWKLDGQNSEHVVGAIDYQTENGLVASGHSDGFVRLWDPRSKGFFINTDVVIKTKIKAHSNMISGLKWHDSNTLATCSYDCSVKVWDVRSKGVLNCMNHNDKLFALDWNNNVLAVGGEESSLYLYSK